jgi:membrane associated rhomboid family serine protease/Zn-finger nucleic acid-binding protein
MLCPNCQKPLHPFNYHSIIIDLCAQCGGLWFDPQELPAYIETFRKIHEFPPLALSEATQKAHNIYTLAEQHKKCPRCLLPMTKFNYAYNSNVFLDRCSICQGIWTDRDEIVKAVRFNQGNSLINKLAEAMAKEQKDFQQQLDTMEAFASVSSRVPLILLFMPKIILPLTDDNPRINVPWVTLILIGLNISIFWTQLLFLPIETWPALYQRFGLIPSQFMAGDVNITLFTAFFLHGGLFHLLGNMFFLWLFGDNVEDRFGPVKFLLFYLACGLAANCGHIYFHQTSTVPLIGASGAVSGIMGAYLVLFPKIKIKTLLFFKVIDIPAIVFLIGWLGLQFFNSWLAHLTHQASIAWWAHIGGFIFGGFLVYFFKTAKIGLKDV